MSLEKQKMANSLKSCVSFNLVEVKEKQVEGSI
jgi:hypothetical protein